MAGPGGAKKSTRECALSSDDPRALEGIDVLIEKMEAQKRHLIPLGDISKTASSSPGKNEVPTIDFLLTSDCCGLDQISRSKFQAHLRIV